MSDDYRRNEIWLEVTNVRRQGTDQVYVQLRGDKADREPVWWSLKRRAGDDGIDSQDKIFKKIIESLDKKRIVLASLRPNGADLQVEDVRIQFADSEGR